ncbi:MAG: VanZ family protein [Lachnospiraceae bacterium]|nr:VanZ family protein [Lachnospiraceae bacterium]
MKHQITQKRFQQIFTVIFFFYMIILIKIILLKDTSLSELPSHLSGEETGFRSLNLIPFQTFRDFSEMFFSGGNFLWSISNIAGNCLVFLPFGYLLSLLSSKKHASVIILLYGTLLSLCFEICQYAFYLGSADIDDLLLNVSGVLLGILCFRFIAFLCQKDLQRICSISLFLGFFSFAGAAFIGWYEFGSRIGIAHYQEETIGGEKVPKSAPDFQGYFSSCSDTQLLTVNSVDSDYADFTKIQLKKDTAIYYQKYEYGKLNPYKMRNIYKLYDISHLKTVKKNSPISIWYKENDKKRTAKVIVFTDAVKSDHSETHSQKSSFNDTDDALTGTIEKMNKTKKELNVNKVDSFESDDGNLVSTTTSIYVPVRYTKAVEITVRDVYENGESYKDHKGSPDDLKKERFVNIA